MHANAIRRTCCATTALHRVAHTANSTNAVKEYNMFETSAEAVNVKSFLPVKKMLVFGQPAAITATATASWAKLYQNNPRNQNCSS
jgi:peroxiredoxin